MKTPSYVGESSAVIAVINFIYFAISKSPSYTHYLWVIFGFIFILDWMTDGISDKGICKKCFR